MSFTTPVTGLLESGSPEFFSCEGGGGYGVKGRRRNKYLRCFVRFSRSSFIKFYYNFMLIQNEIQCGPDRDYEVRYSVIYI
jgi:hypothetical protein